jgi:hypothetical protein
MGAHTRKISVNVSLEIRQDLVRIAARKSLSGKQTLTSDLIRKYIKNGIDNDKNKMK